jgi:hypothetical protein
VRAALGLPEVFDFLHYPVVLFFALAASDRPLRAASRGPARWLAGLLLVVLLSALAHPTDPLRTLFFLLIVGEPLVVIWAISRWGTDEGSLRTVGAVAALLAVMQIPIGAYQGITYGWADQVQGTLVGHGAGAHVLGALFALALFVIVAAMLGRRVKLVAGGIACVVCTCVIFATGAMSVLVFASFAVAVEPFLIRSRSRSTGKRTRRWGSIVVVLLLTASILAVVAALYPGFYQRASKLATSSGDYPEVSLVKARATSDGLTLLLGSGPGTSSSRASLLLVYAPTGSPLAFLGLAPTEFAIEIAAATAISNARYGGSVESAASGVLGVVGDLGLVGLVAYGVLLFAIWRRLGQSGSWLAPAARSSLLMVAALSLVDNWFEYPEFSVPLAILIGFAVSDLPNGTD